MKIQTLLNILKSAPDKNREVYIPHIIIMPTTGNVHQEQSTEIGYNFDDNNDLDLSVINKD